MKIIFNDQLTTWSGPSILLKNIGNHLPCEIMLVSQWSDCLLKNLNNLIYLLGAMEDLSPQGNILFGMAKRCTFFFSEEEGRKYEILVNFIVWKLSSLKISISLSMCVCIHPNSSTDCLVISSIKSYLCSFTLQVPWKQD